jgi:hypothetical protein
MRIVLDILYTGKLNQHTVKTYSEHVHDFLYVNVFSANKMINKGRIKKSELRVAVATSYMTGFLEPPRGP